MKKKWIYLIIASIIFGVFAYICYKTPLAGDDWGYAINGMKGNPFITSIEFYNSWSGRFFSELSGFILAPNKWLWNIVNPILFVMIFLLIVYIIDANKNQLLIGLAIMFLMLSVKDQVRMETYTWIMGTANYVIPLVLLLLIIYSYKRLIIDYENNQKYFVIIAISSFIASLMMENVAAALLLLNGSAFIYNFFYTKKNKMLYTTIFASTIIGFAILRLSPGATYRMVNEHSSWATLSLFEQIATNWTNFLQYTIVDNKYLIMALSLSMILYTIIKITNIKQKMIFVTIFAISLIQSCSGILYAFTKLSVFELFFDLSSSLSVSLISILLFAMIFSLLFIFVKYFKEKRIKMVCLLILAGTTNGAMLLSPIFGSRSSLFTIYILIIIIGCILAELKITKRLKQIIVVILIIMNVITINKYIKKYELIGYVDNVRMSQIQYYKDNPDIKEAWILRMPIYSIHSADVEQWDTYHMDSFKEYYGLQSDVNVIFYYADEY